MRRTRAGVRARWVEDRGGCWACCSRAGSGGAQRASSRGGNKASLCDHAHLAAKRELLRRAANAADSGTRLEGEGRGKREKQQPAGRPGDRPEGPAALSASARRPLHLSDGRRARSHRTMLLARDGLASLRKVGIANDGRSEAGAFHRERARRPFVRRAAPPTALSGEQRPDSSTGRAKFQSRRAFIQSKEGTQARDTCQVAFTGPSIRRQPESRERVSQAALSPWQPRTVSRTQRTVTHSPQT